MKYYILNEQKESEKEGENFMLIYMQTKVIMMREYGF